MPSSGTTVPTTEHVDPPEAERAERAGPPGRLRPLGRVGSPRAGQLVAAEAAALAVVLALPAGRWWQAAAALALMLVVALAAARFRSRWLYAWVGVLRAYAWRGPDRRGPVDPLAGVEVLPFADRAGTRFGVVVTDRTFTTVLSLEPAGSAAVATPTRDTVDLAALAGALADRDVRLAAVQVLVRSTPAPSVRLDPRAAIAASYRQVGEGVVAQRSVLVCLRLDPALCPGAVAGRGGGDLGACRALASVSARLAAGLGPGVRVRALGPDEARAALDAGTGSAPGPLTESWTGVRSADAVHVAFRLARWRGGDPAVLLAEFAGVPGIAAVLSLTMLPARRGLLHLGLVLRVVGPPSLREWVEAAVAAAAARAGGRVVRLDGEQLPALRQTLPAGGVRWSGPAAADVLCEVDRQWLRRALVPLDRGGVVLGRDPAGRPVVAQLFRDRPATLSAFLDPRVVTVLCYRALAAGARVTVVSARAERWMPLRWLGADDPDVVTIASAGSGDDTGPAGRPDRPHLVVLDAPDVRAPAAQPWRTVLTVLPDLSTRSLQAARAAGPVLLRSLSGPEAGTAAPFLGLPAGADGALAALADDEVGVVERGRLAVVRLGITEAESHLVVAGTGSAADAADPRVRL
jgi:type VII secretion protein EccE